MKKRIKLTDVELAIGMWVYIYLKISESGSDSRSNLCVWKKDYLFLHGKEDYWRNDCLLCERHFRAFTTCRCPLSEDGTDCGMGSTYESAYKYFDSKSHRKRALEACKRIIKVLQEEEGKNEVENGKERE